MTVTIDALTRGLVPQQNIAFQKIDISTLQFNVTGAFTLVLPATPANWQLVTFDSQGEFIPQALFVNWNNVFSVPLLAEMWEHDLTVDPNTGLITETITLSGADFLALLANRVVYPRGTSAWTAQTTTPRTITGPAETVIKTLVTENMVTAGDSARNVPNFTVAADLGRGGTVTYTITPPTPGTGTGTATATLGPQLMDMVRSVAAQSLIGVQINLAGNQLVFDCYIPRDLSAEAVFSTSLGNLRGDTVSDAVPTADVALLEDGASAPNFTEHDASGDAAADPWRRAEIFDDQTSTTAASDLAAAVTSDLTQGASAHVLTITATDIPLLRFGSTVPPVQGYQLGDTVTVAIRPGVSYTDIVSGVELTAGSDTAGTVYMGPATGVQAAGTYGAYYEVVTPIIGNPNFAARGQTVTQRLASQVRLIDKAVAQAKKAGQ